MYEISSNVLIRCLTIVTSVNIAMRIRAQIVSPLLGMPMRHYMSYFKTQSLFPPLPPPLHTLPAPFDIKI
jgi:hypothetical protein